MGGREIGSWRLGVNKTLEPYPTPLTVKDLPLLRRVPPVTVR